MSKIVNIVHSDINRFIKLFNKIYFSLPNPNIEYIFIESIDKQNIDYFLLIETLDYEKVNDIRRYLDNHDVITICNFDCIEFNVFKRYQFVIGYSITELINLSINYNLILFNLNINDTIYELYIQTNKIDDLPIYLGIIYLFLNEGFIIEDIINSIKQM